MLFIWRYDYTTDVLPYIYILMFTLTHLGITESLREERGLIAYADNEGPDQTAHAQSDQGLQEPLAEHSDTSNLS